MESRIVDGMKVVEVEPGAPLPPGVPPWAERCELTESTHFSPDRRPWAITAGVLGVLGSIALKTLTDRGTALLIISVGLLYRALVNTTPTVTPSSTGRYLAYNDGIPHAESGMDVASRYVSLVSGVLMMAGAGVALYSGGYARVSGVLLGIFGCCLLYEGVKGHDSRDEPIGQRTPLRFLALADPTRPLAAGDPISAAPPQPVVSTEVAPRDGS